METKPSISTGALHPLISRVQRTRDFGRLRSAVERAQETARSKARREGENTGVVHLSGLHGSAPVFLLEALRQRLGQPILVVCPDQEAAEDVCSDLGTVSGARTLLFPERDIVRRRHDAYENLAVRGDRNEALLRIVGGDADVVVTSLLGFLEKTITADALRSNRTTFAVGDAVELETVRKHLVDAGYDVVPVVEEAGQFAVRGSILDVFDPSWERPARIELFDDEVISIRTFDLDTQLSVERVESVSVLPAASVPFDEAAVTDGQLRGFLETAGFESGQIDRIEAELLQSRHSYLWRRYAPALGMTGALLDFFPETPLLWILQGEAQNRAYEKLEEDMAFAVQRLRDEPPLLGLDDYLHPPGYFERYGAACAIVWDLAAASGSNPPNRVWAPVNTGETVVKFRTAAHPSVVGKLDPLIGQIRKLHAAGVSVQIYAETPTQRERLADLLERDEEIVHLPVGWITSGFVWEDASIAVFTDHQIFNRMLARPRKRQKKRRVQGFRHEHLQLGDFVVHVDYGIGRFVGLEKVGRGGAGREEETPDRAETECLTIRYQGDDRIFVPLDQMHLVEKYVGKEGVVPQLDRLGANKWQKTKERARKAVEDVARDLLAIYAAREVATGHSYRPDTQWQKELEASFPYEETPHQLRATEEIKGDMQRDQPMDRLVCGDVGYGKTEVAIRAAFKAAVDGKQVAILVPTTLLALQHFNTFTERLAPYPLEIRMLSRFVPKAGQDKTIVGLKAGTVDIVIGTHRLLSRDVGFNNLGLLVVDEEHRFGVKHKERLKRLAEAVDVLSLTATPIPRTLYMSLSGLREISIIDTPPRNRHPVMTEVVTFDEEVIRRAIADEIARDGQVFFVHNRVESIHSMHGFLENLLPGVRFCVAHGQMSERQLEKVMLDFVGGKHDVLVSTMIIESGLDLPNVNTIIVNRADRFGLAQLYQLRGRVGRREQQAYAYFLVPRQLSLTESASRRLQAMEEFEELGSGYRLAMRDLEIRGAGNVLGLEQHGHVAAIGFELYCKMLKEEVEKLRGEEKLPVPDCRVESPYTYYIPDTYVEDADERVMIYKRLATLKSLDDVRAMEAELTDRFGELPAPARYLLDLTAVKTLAALQGIASVRFRLDRSARERARQADKLERALSGVERISRGAGAGALAGGADRGTAEFEFVPGRSFSPSQCLKLVETFESRLLFKSGAPFGVKLESEPAERLLMDAKNLLQVAYFSNKI